MKKKILSLILLLAIVLGMGTLGTVETKAGGPSVDSVSYDVYMYVGEVFDGAFTIPLSNFYEESSLYTDCWGDVDNLKATGVSITVLDSCVSSFGGYVYLKGTPDSMINSGGDTYNLYFEFQHAKSPSERYTVLHLTIHLVCLHNGTYQEATCTHGVICDLCGFELTSNAPHHTNTRTIPYHASTCVEEGNLEYVTCDDCGGIFLEDEYGNLIECYMTDIVIETLADHQYESKSDGESHWQECKVCGNKKDVQAHSFSWKWDGSGHHYQQCSQCGYQSTSEAHTFGAWSESGNKRTRTCSQCGYQESETILGSGANGEESQAASAESSGTGSKEITNQSGKENSDKKTKEESRSKRKEEASDQSSIDERSSRESSVESSSTPNAIPSMATVTPQKGLNLTWAIIIAAIVVAAAAVIVVLILTGKKRKQ